MHLHAWNWLWIGLFAAAILAVLVVVLLRIARTGAPRRGESAAEETLRQRYARGELSRDEFRRMLEDLRR